MCELLKRIMIDQDKLRGKPCIRGLSIRVQDILEMLVDGATAGRIRAAIAYAAAQMRGAVVIAA